MQTLGELRRAESICLKMSKKCHIHKVKCKIFLSVKTFFSKSFNPCLLRLGGDFETNLVHFYFLQHPYNFWIKKSKTDIVITMIRISLRSYKIGRNRYQTLDNRGDSLSNKQKFHFGFKPYDIGETPLIYGTNTKL